MMMIKNLLLAALVLTPLFAIAQEEPAAPATPQEYTDPPAGMALTFGIGMNSTDFNQTFTTPFTADLSFKSSGLTATLNMDWELAEGWSLFGRVLSANVEVEPNSSVFVLNGDIGLLNFSADVARHFSDGLFYAFGGLESSSVPYLKRSAVTTVTLERTNAMFLRLGAGFTRSTESKLWQFGGGLAYRHPLSDPSAFDISSSMLFELRTNVFRDLGDGLALGGGIDVNYMKFDFKGPNDLISNTKAEGDEDSMIMNFLLMIKKSF